MRYLVLVPVCAGLMVAVGAGAQVPPAPATGKTMSDMALPGDYFDISQTAQLKVPLGPPAGPNMRAAPSPSPDTTLPRAFEAAQAAEASCRADGYTIAVAVTDAAGNLKAALAPDGTRANGVYMAIHKAVTVVSFRMSTLDLRMKIEQDPSLMAQIKPNMSLLPGGMPIFRGKTFIGAIATSGASAHEEEKCAQAGIAAILSEPEAPHSGG